MFESLLPVLASFVLAVYPNSWKDSLPVCIFGMVGIFIVIGVIVLVTYALNKITSKKSDDDDKK